MLSNPSGAIAPFMSSPSRLAARAFVLAGAALFAVAAAAQSPAPAALPPIADFFDNPAFSGAELSPDARFLAVKVAYNNSRDRLAVIDLAANTIKVVAEFAERDVNRFEWVNKQRLVLDTTDRARAPGERRHGSGLFAVNRDGSDPRQLVSGGLSVQNSNTKLLDANHFLLTQMGEQNSDYVYVTAPKWADTGKHEYTNLMRINTLTGRSETLPRPGATFSWMLDSKGQPRVATMYNENRESVHYLDPADGTWRQIASFDAYAGGKDVFTPLEFGPDGTLYITTQAGKDTHALHTFDLKTGKISAAPVLALDGYDFSGNLVTTHDKLLGIRYLSDARATAWLDEGMKKVQAQVDALLPSTVNLIDVARRAETPWVMVRFYSDRDPGGYALFNTETGKLNPIGKTHPRIRPAEMATQELVHYTARDGLSIPAWLTVPKSGRKNQPMVVLVHGGPYVRGGDWGWSADAQFLASRGYVVLEPEYRGSTGYGTKHYRAGWKQWGLAMQNDIADGTRWAAAQGIADPKRVCIAGASYGGYATLMGLVNDPDLYQCGVNWVGVTDIGLMYTGGANYFSDISEDYKKYGMPVLVGDQVKDAAQLKATSPIAQAARIKRPLLLAYGAADVRVPLYHGKKFLAAVKETNPDVEFIVYDDEAHGWTLPKNRIDFWSKVETFLGRHIGGTVTTSTP